MAKRIIVLNILLIIFYGSFSQGVGIGTTSPDVSAALDITSTNKGLLIPRMNLNSIMAIINPARGLLVYDSVANQLMVNVGNSMIPDWQPVVSTHNFEGWNTSGNFGIDPINHFLGTNDNNPLLFRINGIRAGELHPTSGNVFWGLHTGEKNTFGFSNVAIGNNALKLDVGGSNLVAIGDSALYNNGKNNTDLTAFASNNIAIGSKSLFSNSIGSNNTALGSNSLFNNTEGSGNTAAGYKSLFANTTGGSNTATGFQSLFSNTTGESNTASGSFSLNQNTSGIGNTASGNGSLFSNTTGSVNTATGDLALNANLNGNNNTATGSQALFLNRDGNSNTAVGNNALSATIHSSNNTVIGFNAAFAFDLGSENTLIGANADANQNGLTNATAIGARAVVDASNKVRIGNGAVTVIEGQVPFTTPSDGRFKYQVKEDVKGLDFIMQLRPVTYQFDVKRFDEQQNYTRDNWPSIASNNIMLTSYNEASAIRRTGFIAQEVEKAANVSGYDFSGIIKPKTKQDHYSLSYESFVVPLVKAVQEQQQMIEALRKQTEVLKNINTNQKKFNDNLKKRIEKLEASLIVKK